METKAGRKQQADLCGWENDSVMVAAKKKRNRVQGVGLIWCWFRFQQRGDYETADISTLWRRDSVWMSDAATMEAEVDAIEKQEAQGYCHRRGEHTCGDSAVRLQVDRWQQVQRLLLLRELYYLRVGAEWFVCCGVEAKAM